MLEEGRGPRVPSSRGPKDQNISKSHSNTSLTLKKVHLVALKNIELLAINFVPHHYCSAEASNYPKIISSHSRHFSGHHKKKQNIHSNFIGTRKFINASNGLKMEKVFHTYFSEVM